MSNSASQLALRDASSVPIVGAGPHSVFSDPLLGFWTPVNEAEALSRDELAACVADAATLAECAGCWDASDRLRADIHHEAGYCERPKAARVHRTPGAEWLPQRQDSLLEQMATTIKLAEETDQADLALAVEYLRWRFPGAEQ